MDRKSIIILLASFALLMGWYGLVSRLYPPKPLPKTAQSPFGTTNLPSKGTSSPAAAEAASTTSAPLATPVISAPLPASTLPRPGGPEQTLQVENDNARYLFTSHGGGLALVELKRYPQFVGCKKDAKGPTNQLATLNTAAPVAAFTILGGEAVQGDGVFELSKTATGVRAEKLLSNGLHLVKEFQPSTNYLLKVSIRLENRSKEPLRLPAQEWVIGTATPVGQQDESIRLGLQWFNGDKATLIGETWFGNRTLGCFPGTPRTDYAEGASNVLWAAVQNQFFTMATVPQTPAPAVVAHRIELPPPTKEQLAADPKAFIKPFGYQAGFVYPGMVLATNQVMEHRFEIFAGPKEYYTLSRLGRNLDLVMDFGGFFGFFAKGLLLSMNALHALGLAYGIAIIVITVIIKLLFWPLTKASTKSMKRMAALQPQMKALQEKYKDDPKKMNQKLMEFMKANKVNPLGGCLPMLLQIPVFFGFYKMLQSAIELRGAQFLWACDLSQPDTVMMIPGFHFPVNPLPLIMGVTMLWQARLTPPSPGMDPVQQKIMKYMPMMFMVFLYNFSAGLTLYWTVQNLLTIAQMKLTKDPSGPASSGAKPVAMSPPPGGTPKKKR